MISVLEFQCSQFPDQLVNLVHDVILIIQIMVPVLLIIWGMLDLGKAVIAQKDDEIKKGQQTLIKRITAAAIVFFVIVIVKLLVGVVATGSEGANADDIKSCIDRFVNGTQK